MSVSLGQVSLSETGKIKKKEEEMCLSCSELFDVT